MSYNEEMELLTRWKQQANGKWITEVGELLPDGCVGEDVTKQLSTNIPPDPNAVHLRVYAPDKTIAGVVIALAENLWTMWGPGWPPDDLPNAAEFGQMVAKLGQLGIVDGALISQLARTNTRRVNARLIRGWMKDRPKQQ